MDIYQIENRIREYENDIDNNIERISQLKRRIEELENIVDSIVEKQEAFEDYQNSKRTTYEKMREDLKNMKFAVQCSEERIAYINGQEAIKAINAFANSKEAVRKQIYAKEEEIEELERENRYLRNLIYDLEAEKRQLQQNGGI